MVRNWFKRKYDLGGEAIIEGCPPRAVSKPPPSQRKKFTSTIRQNLPGVFEMFVGAGAHTTLASIDERLAKFQPLTLNLTGLPLWSDSASLLMTADTRLEPR